MPATPLNIAEKFSALDGLELVWLPLIAATTLIPTRAEIDAGTDLTTEIAGWDGFEVDPQDIETPSLARYTGTIPGRIQITPGVLRIYADRGADDARDILSDGTVGYLAWFDSGDVAAEKMDVWPVQVNRLSKARSMEDATLLSVRFSHPRLPVEDLTVPAYATGG
jgi:hypothetical protein